MKKLILILTFLFPLLVAAQADTIAEQEVLDIFEEQPVYPGGDSAMVKFIKDNLVYPVAAVKDRLQGRVIVRFIVEKDGSVSHVKAVKSFNESYSNEVVGVVKLMKWNPGNQKGKAVRVRVALPISFRLQ